jgi:hypothetical protein
MGTGVDAQRDDGCCEHAGTQFLDVQILGGSREIELQLVGLIWKASAPGTSEYRCYALHVCAKAHFCADFAVDDWSGQSCADT